MIKYCTGMVSFNMVKHRGKNNENFLAYQTCHWNRNKFVALLWKGGVFTMKRVRGMSGGKEPLFTLSQPLQKTLFSPCISSTRLHFNQQFSNIQQCCQKISSAKPPNLALISQVLQAPIFGPSSHTPLPKWNLESPLPGLYTEKW